MCVTFVISFTLLTCEGNFSMQGSNEVIAYNENSALIK
jgi:hypothetical protein